VASLFVIQGADQGKRFEFKSSTVALGRDNSNAIRLHDTEVSRRHAELRQDEGIYRVVDLGSANGTFVNGARVDVPHRLSAGDQIAIGPIMLEARMDDEPDAGSDTVYAAA
jgi:pSer/pThr/pTyr-binding forkhead associated (FHA) protein